MKPWRDIRLVFSRSGAIRDAAIYGLGTVLTKSIGFILIPVYTRFLPVSDYGALALLNITLQLLSFVFLFGVSSAAMRYYFENDDDPSARRLYGTAMVLLAGLPITCAAIILLPGYYIVTYFIPDIPFYPHFTIVLGVALFGPMIMLMSGLLRVQRRPIAYISFYLAFFAVQMAAIIVAVVWLGYGLVGQLCAQLITNAVFWVVAVVLMRPEVSLKVDRDVARTLLRFGIPLLPFFIFTWLYTASPRFLLESHADLAAVGLFALALQFGGLITIAGNAVDNALMPRFYAMASAAEPSRDGLAAFALDYLALFAIFGLVVAVASEPLIVLMADPAYRGAAAYAPMAACAMWLYASFRPFYWGLMHGKKTATASWIQGACTGVLIVALVVLLTVLGLGISGVIFAMILANGVLLGLSWHFGVRATPMALDWKLTLATVLLPTGLAFILIGQLSEPIWGVPALVPKFAIAAAVSVLLYRTSGLHRRFAAYLSTAEGR